MIIPKMLSIDEINGRYLLVSIERTVYDVFGWTCYVDLTVSKSVLPADTKFYRGDSQQYGIRDLSFDSYGEYLNLYRYLKKNKFGYLIGIDVYDENISDLKRNMRWKDGDADEIIWIDSVGIHGYLGAGYDGINNTCELKLITHSTVYSSCFIPLKDIKNQDCKVYIHEFIISHKNEDKFKTAYQNYKVIFNYSKMVLNPKEDEVKLLGNLTDGVKAYIEKMNPYGVIAEVSYSDGKSDKYLIKSHNSLVRLIPARRLPYVFDIRVIVELPVKPKIGEFHYVYRASSNGDLKQGYIRSFFLNTMKDLYRVVEELRYRDDEVFVIYDRG